MTIGQEIEYLRNQISINQQRFARYVELSDQAGMQDIEQKNRGLIDRLNHLTSARSSELRCGTGRINQGLRH